MLNSIFIAMFFSLILDVKGGKYVCVIPDILLEYEPLITIRQSMKSIWKD